MRMADSRPAEPPAIVYWLWRLARALAPIVPRRVAYLVADLVAEFAWLVLFTERNNTIENMLHVVGPDQHASARRYARRSFHNYAKYVADFIRHPQAQAEDIDAKLDFEGWDRIDAVLAEGRGAIFVLMHFGNWDLGGAVLALRGYPINVIAEAHAHSRLNDDLVEARTVRGVKLIPMERAAWGIARAMRRNELLAILIDRPLTEGGIEVDFFGSRTQVPAGPARIALRTGAPAIPVALVRVSGKEDRIRAIVDFDLHPVRTGNNETDVQALTQQIISAHERFIRRCPDQWYMFRRMWPTASVRVAEHAPVAAKA